MDTDDINILRTELTAAVAKQHRAHGYGTALARDTHDLIDDLTEAWRAAFDRVTGADRAAEIRAAVRRNKIAEAERLLAAERAA
jgi:hypothetical protein